MSMKSEKLVSIILPVYNGAKYVAKSIESIINQTYQNWELIIVNDCSTDNTLQIVNKYQEEDSRIRVISNEKNLRLPLTLNVGFSQARGMYYTWTSDDNMYKPQAISRLVEVLERNPTIDMVYSDYTNIDENGNMLDDRLLLTPEMLVFGNVCGASFMYTAQIAKQVGNYDSNLFLAEDYDYWIRIYQNGKMKHISENLYWYRQHSGTLTETKRTLVKVQTYKVIEKNFLFLYTEAKRIGKQYLMFDNMLGMIPKKKYNSTKEMLIGIESGYKNYLIWQKIKRRVRNSSGWNLLRKIIRKV